MGSAHGDPFDVGAGEILFEPDAPLVGEGVTLALARKAAVASEKIKHTPCDPRPTMANETKKYPLIPNVADGDANAPAKLCEVGIMRYLDLDEQEWQKAELSAKDASANPEVQARGVRISQCRFDTGIDGRVVNATRVRMNVKAPVDKCRAFFLSSDYQTRPDVNPDLHQWLKMRAIREGLSADVREAFYRYIKVKKTAVSPVLDSVDFVQHVRLADVDVIVMTSAFYGSEQDGFTPKIRDPVTGEPMNRVQNFVSYMDFAANADGSTDFGWTSAVDVDGLTNALTNENELLAHTRSAVHFAAKMEELFQ